MSHIWALLDTFHWLDLEVPKPRRSHDPVLSGVYILVDGEQIAYVGSSFHICARVRSHLSQDRFDFDRALYMELPRRIADVYEAALVRHLEPRRNARGWVYKDRSADAEILYGLGLRSDLSIEDVQWESIQ